MNCTRCTGRGGRRTLRPRTVAVALTVALAWATFPPAYAQVRVVGGATSLSELVDSSTLVTVVLKGGAQDPNQRVTGVESDRLIVESETGARNVYRFTDVDEVRVQSGQVQGRRPQLSVTRALDATEQGILARAVERAAESYSASEGNQALRMMAAGVLVASDSVAAAVMSSRSGIGDINAQITDARNYLEQLARSNDIETAVMAASQLWEAGYPEPAGAVVEPAIKSGSRKVRAAGAQLAGLVGDRSVEYDLLRMLDDRSADVSAPAAVALARLGNREVIPQIVAMAMEIGKEKGDAAVQALTILGGPDVIEAVKERLERAQNLPRFRLAMVLFNLDDPLGHRLLEKEYLAVPSLAREAAIALAKRGNPAGLNHLRKLLEGRYDETVDNMVFRARAAAALITGGDLWAVSIMQEAMRNPNPVVKILACAYAAESGQRTLLSVLQPAVEESRFLPLSIMGSAAVLAIADSRYHERITVDPIDADLKGLSV